MEASRIPGGPSEVLDNSRRLRAFLARFLYVRGISWEHVYSHKGHAWNELVDSVCSMLVADTLHPAANIDIIMPDEVPPFKALVAHHSHIGWMPTLYAAARNLWHAKSYPSVPPGSTDSKLYQAQRHTFHRPSLQQISTQRSKAHHQITPPQPYQSKSQLATRKAFRTSERPPSLNIEDPLTLPSHRVLNLRPRRSQQQCGSSRPSPCQQPPMASPEQPSTPLPRSMPARVTCSWHCTWKGSESTFSQGTRPTQPNRNNAQHGQPSFRSTSCHTSRRPSPLLPSPTSPLNLTAQQHIPQVR